MQADNSRKKFQKELNAGAISLVLLAILHKQREPMYGYEIAKQLESLAKGRLPMHQGAIYPALRSLERQGLLRSRMIPSDSGPPRKYYQMTAAGRAALADWKPVWQRIKHFVDVLLEGCNERDSKATDSKVSRSART
jgi:PadR family transcriptional regulator PadR